ncbi:MAG: hypothetical protein IT282_11725 [Bacteroidetes bacterium]|nr:hypothetical protein [Bacteroidota bacterium]
MRAMRTSVLAIAFVFLSSGRGDVFLLAQQPGSNSTVFIGDPVWAGSYLLIPNRYRIEHIADGSDHFVVFTKILSDYTGEVGPAGKEVARVRCALLPVENSSDNIELVYSASNTSGEYVLSEVRLAGEHVKHVF